MTIRIVTVCTGNICRSPLAAQLLSADLDPQRFSVTSGGTAALIGYHMPDQAQRIAARLGIPDVGNHRGAALVEDELAAADLVLGMTREHRRRAALLQPQVARRAFTLVEFGHIVSHIPDQRLAELMTDHADAETVALTAATRMRGTVPRLTPDNRYDVEDPYGRSKHVYERSAKSIETAVHQVVNFFQRAHTLIPTRTTKEELHEPR